MSRFITRGELHKAKYPTDYEALHTAMKKQGFLKEIEGSDNKMYELPTAEYYKISDSTLAEVLTMAKNTIKDVWEDYSVICSIVTQSTWHNLKIITAKK